MAIETYGKGRIVISGPHPEDPIWDNGTLIDKNDTDNNNLWDGLIKWQGRKNIGDHNKWFLRREVAWAAGLDEHQLPPLPGQIEQPEPDEKKPSQPKKTIIELLIEFVKKLFTKS